MNGCMCIIMNVYILVHVCVCVCAHTYNYESMHTYVCTYMHEFAWNCIIVQECLRGWMVGLRLQSPIWL